jgi:hypothetical protein
VPDVQPRPKNRKGEIIPFTTPSHVIMTLVSSTRAKIAFVAPKEVVVSTLYSPYSRETIPPPTGCSWEKGSLAGDFLALRGFCSSNGSYVSLRTPCSDEISGGIAYHIQPLFTCCNSLIFF